MAKKSYEDNGVLLSKKVLYVGDRVKVSYTGLLSRSGAKSIFLHAGFGDKWENSLFIPMELEQGKFSAELEILDSKNFGICFKDCAEHWDNNSEENYVFNVSKKPVKKEKDLIKKVSKVSTKSKK
ncbi:MAG: carbohydrate-binding protein [Ruminiclostridium sp.]